MSDMTYSEFHYNVTTLIYRDRLASPRLIIASPNIPNYHPTKVHTPN